MEPPASWESLSDDDAALRIPAASEDEGSVPQTRAAPLSAFDDDRDWSPMTHAYADPSLQTASAAPAPVDLPVILVNWTRVTDGAFTKAAVFSGSSESAELARASALREILSDFDVHCEAMFEAGTAFHSTMLTYEVRTLDHVDNGYIYWQWTYIWAFTCVYIHMMYTHGYCDSFLMPMMPLADLVTTGRSACT